MTNRSPQPRKAAPDPSDRARLEAHRARLERLLDAPETPAREVAALGREYRATLAALSALAEPSMGGTVTALASRRSKKGA